MLRFNRLSKISVRQYSTRQLVKCQQCNVDELLKIQDIKLDLLQRYQDLTEQMQESFEYTYECTYENSSILRWMSENQCYWDLWACLYAALNDHTPTIEWLKNTESPDINNHFAAQRWLKETSQPWNEWACINAVKRNDLGLIKWLSQSGYKLTPDVFNAAAFYGRYEIVLWLHNQIELGLVDPNIGEFAYYYAQVGGHSELASLLFENGYPTYSDE